MKAILNSPYRYFFLAGFLVISLSAWFSLGYHQMDEHFMILEYPLYKAGVIPQRLIPWEFLQEIRPSLQPYLAQGLFSLLHLIGIDDAFIRTFILRLLSGWLAWWVTARIGLHVAASIAQERLRKCWIGALSLLWFLPYLDVRFSSENMAGIAFVSALLVLPVLSEDRPVDAPLRKWVITGLLLAFSFFFRFQMAFAIIGLLVWILLKGRPLKRAIAGLCLGALLGIGINLFADYSFYGHWVLTPYNYFHANIVQDAASDYGVNPWYDYVLMFIGTAAPPLSIVLLCLFATGMVKNFFKPMVFVMIPFLLGHMSVPHKELRFLFPVLLPFLIICLDGLKVVWHFVERYRGWRIAGRWLIGINCALLLFRTFSAAKPNHYYYRYLYHQPEPVHLVTLGPGIFDEGYNEIFLYRPKGFTEDTLTQGISLTNYIDAHPRDSYLVLSYQLSLPPVGPEYEAKRVYVYLPDAIINIQMNDWQSRSDIWSIWRVTRKKS
ncbi:hypothetical protein [Rurimicrobium arvi]|uniref:Alg9-like mannosyltransferase family protein n=1 Tax=Rurimicrobium arvi TaxID=2049916 RepID=A0ABP8MKL9_9BACT